VPHLDVYASESDLAGREEALIGGLTEAVVAVYGEWARPAVVVRLIGLPAGRWGIGGHVVAEPAPGVTFGINEKALARPDAATILAGLAAGVTDAIAGVVGERVRDGVTIDFVAQADERFAAGGAITGQARPND
jgi:phenylpyruvate tautomerase PptA (4-oxalocrotonate tautomerase family)